MTVHYKHNECHKYEICIVIENMLYYLDFGFINPKSLFSFLPLHVHHQYYIKGKEPWDYDDSGINYALRRLPSKEAFFVRASTIV